VKVEFDPVANAAYFEISDNEVGETKEIEKGLLLITTKMGM